MTCNCGKPTRDDRYVCDDCKAELTKALANVPFLNDELDTHISRQRSAPISGGAASREKGLHWHEKAADAKRNLHGLLVTWVRFCREEHVRGSHEEPTDNLPSLSRWLMWCVDGLTLHDIGPEAVREITDAVADCRRIVFWKRRERTYLGPCGVMLEPQYDDQEPEPCPGEVYADPDADVGNCDDCGQGHTVVIRQSELDRKLFDRLCTPAEIARLSTFLGLDVSRDAVRRKVLYWHRHKRIEVKGHDDKGDPLFRYGDVRPRLYSEFATQDARGA